MIQFAGKPTKGQVISKSRVNKREFPVRGCHVPDFASHSYLLHVNSHISWVLFIIYNIFIILVCIFINHYNCVYHSLYVKVVSILYKKEHATHVHITILELIQNCFHNK